ncbi:MAG TPA: hypothetical protein DEA08_38740 [Planctomycetes bacterium]|nr:hypothetical protein [Planctomycetota bacterium]
MKSQYARASSARLAACVFGALASGATGCVSSGSSDQHERVGRTAVRAVPSAQERAQTAYLRGLELALADDHEAAIQAFYTCVELDPLRADAHYRAGLCHYSLGDYARERAEYHKALSINPRAARVWRALGEACLAADLLSEARNAFDFAIKLEPHPTALFNLALIEEDLGNGARSQQLYKRCLELSREGRLSEQAKSRLRALELRTRGS